MSIDTISIIKTELERAKNTVCARLPKSEQAEAESVFSSLINKNDKNLRKLATKCAKQQTKLFPIFGNKFPARACAVLAVLGSKKNH